MSQPPYRDKLIMSLCDQLVGLGALERDAFLDTHCGDNVKLRKEVEELLASIENSGEFLCLDNAESEG